MMAAPMQQPGYATYGGMQSSQQKKGLAVASMVCGIVGFCIAFIPFAGAFISLVLAVLAVVMGGIAISKANKQPAEFGGKGMAITGLVLGIIQLAFVVLVLIFFASLFAALAGA